MPRIIDEMPTQGEVEGASPEQIVEWQLYLRETMVQEELHIVKAIARRYDGLSPSMRERIQLELRRQHG